MTVATEPSRLRVERPDVVGPLAVFGVFRDPGPAPELEYTAFAAAAALGASVRELQGGASVNDLLVDNPLDVGVLLYEGEEVHGAQQDRTFDASVLVPARSRLTVPVSCVEAGRWDGSRHGEAFTPAEHAAFPALRRAKSRAAHATGRAVQQEVWAMVDHAAARHGASSQTGALRDVFAARHELFGGIRRAVTRRDGQIGMVAVIAGEICVADVVGRADVFAALHGPVLTGYALDAAEHATDDLPTLPSVDTVEAFLAACAHGDGERATAAGIAAPPTLGLGELERFSGVTAEGARLTCGGELVALTAFPAERPRPARARVSRPSRRR